ncbi:hypothetical protein FAF44_53045, partial [Nonomuraea sp. MG754425]|nr:hypothetical protein [Nonomuraea sp. MG754425]
PDLSGLDGWFGSLLRECLDKEPARRPTAAQVVERLSVLPAPLRQGTALANTAPGAAVDGQTDTGPATVSAPVTAAPGAVFARAVPCRRGAGSTLRRSTTWAAVGRRAGSLSRHSRSSDPNHPSSPLRSG